MHQQRSPATPRIARVKNSAQSFQGPAADGIYLRRIRPGDAAGYGETPEARWVRKGLIVLVVLCCVLAAFIWWQLLAGTP
jgi:hypothetical protein